MNLDQMFLNLLNRSVIAGLLVLAILVLRLALKKAPKWIHCVLWVLVAVRLIVPLGIVSPLSALSVLGQSRGGSVEYFHAGGGSEKPLVEFETVRIESPAPEQTVLSELPGTGLGGSSASSASGPSSRWQRPTSGSTTNTKTVSSPTFNN